MGIIELILVAIRGLAVVTNNPALGGGSSVRMQEASELLALLGELLERGDEAHDELVAFTKVVEGMAQQGRAPSTVEWQALRARSDAAHDVIQEAAAATEEPEPEPEPEPELSALTNEKLLEMAAERGISVAASSTKAQIIAALEAGTEE